MRIRSLAPLLLAGALGVGLTACGGGDDGGDTADTTPADVDLVVTALDGIRWDAEEYTATAGENVVLLDNVSSLQHNLYFVGEDGTELPDSLDAGAKSETTSTVDLPAGTYTLICKIPGHGNMKATLTVS